MNLDDDKGKVGKAVFRREMQIIFSWDYIQHRDVSTGATGATAVAPKFSDTLTLLQPGGQILPTIAGVAPKFFPWLRPWPVIN